MYRSLFSCVKLHFENTLKLGCGVHTSTVLDNSKKWTYKSLPIPDEGTDGERAFDIDYMIDKKSSVFPDENSHLRLFDGVTFEKLPICNIRVSPNNSIFSITSHDGVVEMYRSCGIEGFKNTRKGTNIAAQATAITIASKAHELGVKTVRVRVRGLGPGRMAAIKGLQMGGLNIVSVTDNTRVTWNPQRARKAKRL